METEAPPQNDELTTRTLTAKESPTGRPAIVYDVSEPQARAFKSKAKYLLLAGAAGSGKSIVANALTRQHVKSRPNGHGYVGRWHATNIDASTLHDWYLVYPRDREATINKPGNLHIAMPHNCRVDFGPLADIAKLKNKNLDVVLIEQAEELPEVRMFAAAAIWARKEDARVIVVANFDNCEEFAAGVAWLKDLFVTNEELRYAPAGTKHPDNGREFNPDFEYINFKTADNAENLSAGYIESLVKFLPDDLRQSMIEGIIPETSSRIYEELRRDVHIITPFEIPPEWDRWEVFDWGVTSSFLVGLTARISPAGEVIFTDELYQKNCLISNFASQWHALHPETGVDLRIIDAPDWQLENKNRKHPGEPQFYTYYDEFREQGLEGQRARAGHNVEKFSGIQQVRKYLTIDPARKHPFEESMGSPSMFIFSTCQRLIRDMFTWRDADKHEPDGCACVRYVIVRRPPPTVIPDKPKDPFSIDQLLSELHAARRANSRG